MSSKMSDLMGAYQSMGKKTTGVEPTKEQKTENKKKNKEFSSIIESYKGMFSGGSEKDSQKVDEGLKEVKTFLNKSADLFQQLEDLADKLSLNKEKVKGILDSAFESLEKLKTTER